MARGGGGTVYSTADGLRVDHLQCHGRIAFFLRRGGGGDHVKERPPRY